MACHRLIRAVLLALLLPFASIGPALAISDPAEMLPNAGLEARAEQIGRQLRCLVCQNESIEDSGADLAHDLRTIVRQRVAAGDTDRQVTAWMVARYGDFVRLKPPFTAVTALLWLSPILAISSGFALVIFGRRSTTPPAPPLSQAELTRITDLTRR